MNVRNGIRTALLCTAIGCATILAEGTHVRMYQIGNSVSDGCHMGDMVKYMVASRNNTADYGKNIMLGAPLWFIWANPGGFENAPYGAWTTGLKDYQWDALILQPYDASVAQDSQNVRDFLNYTLIKSPNVTCYIFAYQVAHNTDNPNEDYSVKWLSNDRVQSRVRHEALVNAINTAYAGTGVKTCRMIPLGEVYYEVDKKIKAGQMAGLNSIWDCYSDGIHLTSVGSYITALTHYTVLYQDDPVGLPTTGWTLDAALALKLQQTVRDVVLAKGALTGVTGFGPYTASGVRIFPRAIELNTGKAMQLAYGVLPTNATNKSVLWSSSASSVATVSNGLVTAVSAGSAKIIVTTVDGSHRDTCAVTVTASGTAVDGVAITPDSLSILKGATASFSATVLPAGATNKTVTWYSLDSTIASVGVSGLVTARAKGRVKIVAMSLNGGKTDTGIVKVTIVNNPPVPVLDLTTTIAYAPVTIFVDGHRSTDPDPADFVLGYDWDFGDNTPIVTTNTAKHTFAQPGTYTVRLRVVDNNETRSAWISKQVLVKPPYATLLAYDGFEDQSGLPLHMCNGGQGWGDAWNAQDDNSDTTGLAITSNQISYTGLLAQGNATKINKDINNARKFNLDTAGPFKGYLVGENIGRAGTTLWTSVLIKKGTNDNGRSAIVLTKSNFWLWWGTPDIMLGYLGTSCNSGTSKYWGIGLNDVEFRSDAPVTIGEVALLVAKIEFAAGTTTVSLYVNPPVGVSPPGTATFTKVSTTPISLKAAVLMGGSAGSIADELRFGTSFANVVPAGSTIAVRQRVQTVSSQKSTVISVASGVLRVEGIKNQNTVTVCDAAGRSVRIAAHNAGGVFTTRLGRGVYLVKVRGAAGVAGKIVVVP